MATIFDKAKSEFLKGGIPLVSGSIKAILLNNAFVPDYSVQQFKSDITANEVTGTGYTAGGKALTGKAVTNLVGGQGKFDADDVSWDATAGSLTARFVALVYDTGTPATSPLIYLHDFGADQNANLANFIVQWNASGIIQLS